MAIGRSWEESMQKALRMVDSSVQGFQEKPFDDYMKACVEQTDQRVFALALAMKDGYLFVVCCLLFVNLCFFQLALQPLQFVHRCSVDEIHDATKIDKWWLSKLYNIHCLKNKLKAVIGKL